jgi:hypothetical protein
MSEQSRRILDMLAQGRVSVDEAERLLAALSESGKATGQASDAPSDQVKRTPKYLRVLVDDMEDGKPTKVNVRVPLQLLRAGVKLSALIPKDAQAKVNSAMGDKGLNIDLSNLKPEVIEELVQGLSDLQIDVDDENTKVRVFCE